MDAGAMVRALYEAYQRRDWDQAARLLHPDAELRMPATAEQLVGRGHVVTFQREYPEPWGTLTVSRVVHGEEEAAAEIEIAQASGPAFAMAAFWQLRDGLLAEGVEYWVTVGGDPVPDGRPPAASLR